MLRTSVFCAVVFLLTTHAHAADTSAPKTQPASERIDYGTVYFGIDLNTHQSLAGYSGVIFAPGGTNRSGLRLSAFGLIGRYEYDRDEENIRGKFVSTDFLIGWSHVFQNGAIGLYGGGNYQDHKIKPDDPDNPVQGAELGFKVQGDLWINPTQTSLITGLASYSTAFDTYYALGRMGYDFFGTRAFIGPEIAALGNQRTDQIRVGAHITAITIGRAKLNISGGWFHERGEGNGAYGTATLAFTF